MNKSILLFLSLIILTSCFKDELDAANADNELLRSQIVALNSQINSLNSQISSLNSQTTALNAEILRLKEVIKDAESEIDELEEIILSYQTELAELEEIILSYRNQLLELQIGLLGAIDSNQNLLLTNEELLSSVSTNLEVLQYVSNRILMISTEINEENNIRLRSLVLDLKSFLQKYNELKVQGGLNVSLLKHIRATQLLRGVDFFEWGEGSVPGVLTVDCNWVQILTDSRESVISALHLNSNTLLITHASGFLNLNILGSNNSNLKFFENHFGAPKRILYVSSRAYREESVLIEHLINEGHIVDFLRISKTQYDLEDYPELSEENLKNYGGLVYDDGTNRPSEDILNNLKDYVANPTTTTVMSSLGWVWAAYRSVYVGEPLPINSVIEPLGAKFNTWTNDVSISVQVLTNYYPDTYNEIELCE